jgi:hypothetical protein
MTLPRLAEEGLGKIQEGVTSIGTGLLLFVLCWKLELLWWYFGVFMAGWLINVAVWFWAMRIHKQF